MRVSLLKGHCVSRSWAKTWSIERKESRRENKNACLLIVTAFLDLAILDLGNVNFVNKIDFGKE